MCGRYELHSHPAAIALAFGLAHPPDVHACCNVAMTEVPIVRVNAEGRRELVRMRWGLVPRWAKDPSIGAKMINARGETIAEKPSFKMAFRRHRCLLPADGFYEWQTVAGGEQSRKQPLHIGMKDGSLFAMAGLYELMREPDRGPGEPEDLAALVGHEIAATMHDRMPLVVAPENYARWLDPVNAEVNDLIAPYASAAMAYYPISPRVNNVRHDDPALIERARPMTAGADEGHEPPPHPPEQESLF
jgi:putative SOS response-associated peptidase YedK